MRVLSNTIIDGGSNPKTIEQIRESVINNTVGANKTPVTLLQLKENAQRHNYEIDLWKDTVTERVFTISKDITYSLFEQLKSVPDVYLSKTVLVGSEANVKSVRYKDGDAIVINAGETFKNVNGFCLPSDNVEINNDTLSRTDVIDQCANTNYFRTIHTNIVYPHNFITRVFDLSQPTHDSLTIVNKNYNTEFNTDIKEMTIVKQLDKYIITIKLTSLQTTSNANLAEVRGQLALETLLGKMDLVIDGVVSEPGTIVFELPTDNLVGLDDEILINMSSSKSYDVKLNSKARIMLYKLNSVATQDNYIDSKYIDIDSVVGYNSSLGIVGLTHQTFNITFGERLKNVFTDTQVSYTERKYKRYATDVPAYYKEDIYEFNDNCDDLLEPTHKKGDPILDASGLLVYEHSVGDIVMVNNEPVIDAEHALKVTTDLLMMEYEYTYGKSKKFVDNTKLLKQNIQTHLSFVEQLSENRLELTEFKYKPTKNSGTLAITTKDGVKYVSSVISPKLTLYVSRDVDFTYDKKKIGVIIQSMLNNSTVSVKDIRNKLTELVGIKAVGIEQLFGTDDDEVFTISGGTPVIKKLIMLEDDVEYDIEIKVKSI
jgi:hypothetical protein